MTSTPELVFVAPRGAKPPRHLADLTLAERRAAVAELGEKPFRADQLSRHYFTRLSSDPATMTDIPSAARETLTSALMPKLLTAAKVQSCDDGTTIKTLWRGFDGAFAESVLMRYPDRATVCVSSQSGCGMACPFCATGQAGLTRNMSTAEIVEQVVDAAAAMAPCPAAPDGCPTSCSWAWASRWPTTTGCSGPSGPWSRLPPRASACRSGRSRSPPSASYPPCSGSPTRGCR
jgi:hypothetical protein